MDRELLLKRAKDSAKTECQRAKAACEEFERENGRKPFNKERTQINGRSARMISVVVDMKTNREYVETSGRAPSIEKFHALLRERMPKPGLEPVNNLEATRRHPKECAEVQAANQALHARVDAQISDLMIATLMTEDETPHMRCENCKVTLAGAIVITDEMAEQETL